MDKKRRDLILQLADGNPECFPILHHLDKFLYSEQIFRYMIKEKFTGKNLEDLYKKSFSYSWLSLGKWMIMKIKKEKNFAPIIGGVDYRV